MICCQTGCKCSVPLLIEPLQRLLGLSRGLLGLLWGETGIVLIKQ